MHLIKLKRLVASDYHDKEVFFFIEEWLSKILILALLAVGFSGPLYTIF
jgi:hypothetical protein